ncbi:threonine-phosphate decarboxylase [Colwellia echini]|uniref:Aminotransferase n=1 Tax=Colwellia echini TaxID=1982103 RepID=A0ABY3MXM3_9GAMM|nr:threonine-phosphate decarboxylase [Colwellia echini]TYK65973.1 pyridoxal phosphate-dependent class II aminotransferase [Colwellia echini]
MALIHGGQLQQVAQQYSIPFHDWLDVSTGIAPTSYPIPQIPSHVWQQLPQYNPDLIAAAKHYYQCESVMVTNGSQAIIKALPDLYRQKKCSENSQVGHVYLPERGYKEHGQAWQDAGYQLHFYQDNLPELSSLTANCVLVIINPNNPTGYFFEKAVIDKYKAKLQQLNGLLVLDEAFMDVMPEHTANIINITNNADVHAETSEGKSYTPSQSSLESQEQSQEQSQSDHCLILRSFGKFFGLAGIRIGFLIANQQWCDTFKALLGPWQINGPAQVIAQHALQDSLWQAKQRETLHNLRVAQELILKSSFSTDILRDINGCDLFLTLSFNQPCNEPCNVQSIAKQLYHLLCQQGVYCRLSDEQDTLRFGITTQEYLPRLVEACKRACQELAKL